MPNIKYLLKRVANMDYKAMFQKINSIHKITGKSRLSIFNDMRECAIRYGAGYMDYDLFEMYNLTDAERDTYITRGRNNDLIKKYNNPEYAHIFRNKAEFNAKFQDFLGRDWIKVNDTPKEDIFAFMHKHSVFMAKPISGTCGKGIEKINTKDYSNLDEIYAYLTSEGMNFELEEVLVQHKKVSKIYPESINTVRIVTILDDANVPHVICAYFRIGNGKYVDNFNSGGMVAPVDEATGTVIDKAIDKQKNLYEIHPATNSLIKGFAFPDWDKALKLVQEASYLVPEMRYIGWDVCFSTKGPVLVEGNEYPGHDIYQLPEHTHDKLGIWPKFTKAFKNNKEI
ncbi:MAG: hypothetical protein K2J20_06945 [Bacilli bacterium]|nr:hypothetical protein [Bacilli bacterium]